ncbi:MAG: hypothetical protein ACT452_10280 [Microthrixaceae bacterium]
MNARLRLAGGAVAAATLVLTATPAGAGSSDSFHGTFEETASGATFGYDIHGSAKMTVGDGTTTVKVSIAGLDPAKTYGSHLHNGTCADGGGGHYQDAEGGSTTHGNELHLSTTSDPAAGLRANPGGVAHGGGSTAWEARVTSTTMTNARSIVVHEPGAPAATNRITCADLS